MLIMMKKELEDVLARARNDTLLEASKGARSSLDYQSTGTRTQDLIVFNEEECDMQHVLNVRISVVCPSKR